jgi:hypothetical protein
VFPGFDFEKPVFEHFKKRYGEWLKIKASLVGLMLH